MDLLSGKMILGKMKKNWKSIKIDTMEKMMLFVLKCLPKINIK